MSDETTVHDFRRALDEIEQGVRQVHERPRLPVVEQLSSEPQEELEMPSLPGDLPGWLARLDVKLDYLMRRMGEVERFLGVART